MPELPDPSLAWEDLSAVDRRALTEMLVDKIIIERHPSKIDKDGKRHYLIRAIPYQDPEMEAARLKAVHEARVKIVPRVCNDNQQIPTKKFWAPDPVVSEGPPAVPRTLWGLCLCTLLERWPLQSLLCTCCTCGLDALSCSQQSSSPRPITSLC